MLYDFTTVDYAPVCTIRFCAPTTKKVDRNFNICITAEQGMNDIIRLTAWGCPEGANSELILCRDFMEAPDDNTPRREFIMDAITTIWYHSAFADMAKKAATLAGIQDFEFDLDASTHFTEKLAFTIPYPTEIAPAYLPEHFNSDLYLTVEFQSDREGNCSYEVYAFIDGWTTRVHIYSGELTMPEDFCEEMCFEEVEFDNESCDCRICPGALTRAILLDLSENSDEIHDEIENAEKILTSGLPDCKAIKVNVTVADNTVIFGVPDGIDEEDAEALYAIQSFLSSLMNDEDMDEGEGGEE